MAQSNNGAFPPAISHPITHILFKGFAYGKVGAAGTVLGDVSTDHLTAGYWLAIFHVIDALAVSIVQLHLLNLLEEGIGRSVCQSF